MVAVTGASGAAIAVNSYNEYGIPGVGNLGRFQYTGQTWLSEIGMYNYKTRIYSPTLGRFLQTDPIGYGDGLNMYNYVGGDPVNFTDPSGMNASFKICVQVPTSVSPGPGFSNPSPNGRQPDPEIVVTATTTREQCTTVNIPGGTEFSPSSPPSRGQPGTGGATGGASPQSGNEKACKVLRRRADQGKSSLPDRVTDSGVWNDIGWLNAYQSQYRSTAREWGGAGYFFTGVGYLISRIPQGRVLKEGITVGGIVVGISTAERAAEFYGHVNEIEDQIDLLRAAGC